MFSNFDRYLPLTVSNTFSSISFNFSGSVSVYNSNRATYACTYILALKPKSTYVDIYNGKLCIPSNKSAHASTYSSHTADSNSFDPLRPHLFAIYLPIAKDWANLRVSFPSWQISSIGTSPQGHSKTHKCIKSSPKHEILNAQFQMTIFNLLSLISGGSFESILVHGYLMSSNSTRLYLNISRIGSPSPRTLKSWSLYILIENIVLFAFDLVSATNATKPGIHVAINTPTDNYYLIKFHLV